MKTVCRINRASLKVQPFALVCAGAVLAGSSTRAVERDFNIVTNQSSIALSGNVVSAAGTATIQPQGTGSLTTKYTGTIKTDLAASGISFLAGSNIDANTNGSWKPLADGTDGAAVADYGGKATFLFIVTVNFAGRNLVAGLTSSALPIDNTGHFDLSTTSVTFASGDLAYRSSTGDPVGSATIAGKSGALSGTGTLSSLIQGGQITDTLTLPVSSDFVLQPDTSTTINLHLAGQLVATTSFATGVPGDYNQNGVVDAADYDVWRKKLGATQSLPNDDTTGVGPDDYTRWRSQFGQGGAGSGSSFVIGGEVPEPSGLTLLFVAVILGAAGPSSRRALRLDRNST